MNSHRRLVLKAFAFSGAGATLLAGCASTGPTFDAAALPPIPQGQARVIFYCPSTWTLSNIWRRVQIDNWQCGEIGMGEFMVINVDPGMKRVRLWRPSRIAGGSGEQFVRACHALAGQNLYVRFISSFGGMGPATVSFLLDQVPEQLALKQLNGMRQVELGTVHDTSARS